MAAYDSPGFRDNLPGLGNFDARSGTAPGSQGIDASTTNGDSLGTFDIRTPDSGTRVIGRVTVNAGDTSAMSDDNPAHQSGVMPGPAEEYLSTGAGSGNVVSAKRHPWQQAAGGS